MGVHHKILVCGIGNKLKKDDGIGPYVAEQLAQRSMPSNVSVSDFGTSGFKTALEIGQYDKVIFVDAIQRGNEPGHVHRATLSKEDFKGSPSLSSCVVSFHESDLKKILSTAVRINTYPKQVIVLGCEPKDLSFGMGLSPEVQKAVDKIIDLILAEIA